MLPGSRRHADPLPDLRSREEYECHLGRSRLDREDPRRQIHLARRFHRFGRRHALRLRHGHHLRRPRLPRGLPRSRALGEREGTRHRSVFGRRLRRRHHRRSDSRLLLQEDGNLCRLRPLHRWRRPSSRCLFHWSDGRRSSCRRFRSRFRCDDRAPLYRRNRSDPFPRSHDWIEQHVHHRRSGSLLRHRSSLCNRSSRLEIYGPSIPPRSR